MDSKASLGGIAAVIVAVTGLLTAAYQLHLFGLNPATPTPTTTPTVVSPPPTQASFVIAEAILRADPFNFSGSCPVTITFTGRISVSRGSGTVSYRFIRSDGSSAPVQTLTFAGPGSQDVTETWQLGGPGFTYSGWAAIRTVDPQAVNSDHATFTIACH